MGNGMKFVSMMAAAAAISLQKKQDDDYRVEPPEHFTGDDKDIFMHSMYKTYASEEMEEDKDTGEATPTGRVIITEADARALADEVVGTHKGLDGAEKSAYIDSHFGDSWAHYDVNEEGHIEVGAAPQFVRKLLDDNMAHIYSE